MKSKLLLVLFVVSVTVSSCTHRLVDFTVISTKNAEIGVDRSKAVQTEGEAFYFFAQWNLKDAIDNALEKAGPKYDLLVDGVVHIRTIFGVRVMVSGLAVSSQELRAELGEEGYEKWLKENNVASSENPTLKN